MEIRSDIDIAQSVTPQPIEQIAEKIGLTRDDLELYGNYKAKVHLNLLDRLKDRPDGRLILVTAITPTPAG